jgi:hypothetical protein
LFQVCISQTIGSSNTAVLTGGKVGWGVGVGACTSGVGSVTLLLDGKVIAGAAVGVAAGAVGLAGFWATTGAVTITGVMLERLAGRTVGSGGSPQADKSNVRRKPVTNKSRMRQFDITVTFHTKEQGSFALRKSLLKFIITKKSHLSSLYKTNATKVYKHLSIFTFKQPSTNRKSG